MECRSRGLDSVPFIVAMALFLAALAPVPQSVLLLPNRLKGDRRGQWALTINGRWRLCFRFADGDAYDVEIVDYHRG